MLLVRVKSDLPWLEFMSIQYYTFGNQIIVLFCNVKVVAFRVPKQWLLQLNSDMKHHGCQNCNNTGVVATVAVHDVLQRQVGNGRNRASRSFLN